MCDEKPFEGLVELFKEDPEAFEEYRKERIEKHITEMCGDCPERLERCRRFQWRMEQELAKYKDPLARYNAMVSIFWEQFEEFQTALNQFHEPLSEVQEQKQSADILEFPKRS